MKKQGKAIIPEITQEVKDKFLKDVLLTHDMIQESREDDEFFQGDASLKWQIRAFLEWLGSPCNEHGLMRQTRGQCEQCKRIAYESIK